MKRTSKRKNWMVMQPSDLRPLHQQSVVDSFYQKLFLLIAERVFSFEIVWDLELGV